MPCYSVKFVARQSAATKRIAMPKSRLLFADKSVALALAMKGRVREVLTSATDQILKTMWQLSRHQLRPGSVGWPHRNLSVPLSAMHLQRLCHLEIPG
jgi:hypothetical protein